MAPTSSAFKEKSCKIFLNSSMAPGRYCCLEEQLSLAGFAYCSYSGRGVSPVRPIRPKYAGETPIEKCEDERINSAVSRGF